MMGLNFNVYIIIERYYITDINKRTGSTGRISLRRYW